MKTKKQLSAEILQYDANEIHEACNNIGFSTSWQYFDNYLKTFTKSEMLELLEELQNNF